MRYLWLLGMFVVVGFARGDDVPGGVVLDEELTRQGEAVLAASMSANAAASKGMPARPYVRTATLAEKAGLRPKVAKAREKVKEVAKAAPRAAQKVAQPARRLFGRIFRRRG